jgi:hypothetical protein
MADRESTPRASAERKYRSVNFDQLLDLVSGIPGVPETKDDEVELALTALAFGCAPMPEEFKACINAELALLERRRAWGAATGLPAQEIKALDGEIDLRRHQLRPKTWLTLDRNGKPTLHFLPMRDYCPELSDSSRFTAFLVQAMDVLIAAGMPETTKHHNDAHGKRRQDAHGERRQKSITTGVGAIDVVNAILDLIGFKPTKRVDPRSLDAEAGAPEGVSRNRESLLSQYQRERRNLRSQTFPLHLPFDCEPVQGRYPTPEELRNFVSMVYPGEHGVHVLDLVDVGMPWAGEVIWIPVGQSLEESPKQDAMRPVFDT